MSWTATGLAYLSAALLLAGCGEDLSPELPVFDGGGQEGTGGAPIPPGLNVDAGAWVGVAPTWHDIYQGLFGPHGKSTCSGSDCHTFYNRPFKCGDDESACYSGFVKAGLVTPGCGADSSQLVLPGPGPGKSPLCGVLGGDMPPPGIGECIEGVDLEEIRAWLATGGRPGTESDNACP